jgi:hypothetical protein
MAETKLEDGEENRKVFSVNCRIINIIKLNEKA